MASTKNWWKRTTGNLKDKITILSANSKSESSIIHATSHDDRSISYKHVCRIFSLARTSHSVILPLMLAISKRAERTHSWPVALKSLLLAHGLLLIIPPKSPHFRGRLPFDLSHFRDRSTNYSGFSVFVRSYFQFLDNRAILLRCEDGDEIGSCRIERMQVLLDLLMEIRPCMNGMAEALVIEAMECAVLEMFEVCNRISDCVTLLLVRVKNLGEVKSGLKAVRILKKVNEQSGRVANYLDVCRSLGVGNAKVIDGVEKIPEDVIAELERRVNGETGEDDDGARKEEEEKLDWVIFEDDLKCLPEQEDVRGRCGSNIDSNGGNTAWNGNLIEL